MSNFCHLYIKTSTLVLHHFMICMKAKTPLTTCVNKPSDRVHPDIGLWANNVRIDYSPCRDDYARHDFQTSIFYSGTDSSVIK